MVGPRIPERYDDIDHLRGCLVGEEVVNIYDVLQMQLRDRGILPTEKMIAYGLTKGTALEIGPGAGYVGLEWLKNTNGTNLYWLEISEDMNAVARKNAKQYGMEERIQTIISDATKGFPAGNEFFDLVFSNNSLHEWDEPEKVFNEIYRVLKKGGSFFISDLKRNIRPEMLSLMKQNYPKDETILGKVDRGFTKSVEAAYLKEEIVQILNDTELDNFEVKEEPTGLIIIGTKG
jgi:ubiquinone/menaquinone biosynthesis C-methylase UbiE